jgi:hypothetical protein
VLCGPLNAGAKKIVPSLAIARQHSAESNPVSSDDVRRSPDVDKSGSLQDTPARYADTRPSPFTRPIIAHPGVLGRF